MPYMQAHQELGSIGSTLDAAGKVVSDPALSDVACHLLRLNKITEGKPPGPPCLRRVYTKAQKEKGIGLYMAVKPLRAFIWARQRPAAAIAIGVGAVGALVGLGYLLGRKS